MKLNEHAIDYEKHVNTSKKSFNELSMLIDLATSMQEKILNQKKEVRKIFFMLAIIAYISVMILFIIKVFGLKIINHERFLQLSIVTLVFFVGVLAISVFRIKAIMREMIIERATMQELMEVIFNLRKVIPKNAIDLIDMTVLDLRLKRLRFY